MACTYSTVFLVYASFTEIAWLLPNHFRFWSVEKDRKKTILKNLKKKYIIFGRLFPFIFHQNLDFSMHTYLKMWHLCYLLVVAWPAILILAYIEWYLKYLCHIRILYVQDLIYLFCSLCSSMLFWRKQIIVSNFVAAPGLRKVTMCGWLRLCFMTCEIIYVKLK